VRKAITITGFVAWVLFVSVLLTRLWLAHPDVFPSIPIPIAEYLVRAYGAQNAEDVADLEILIGLSISIPVTALVSWASLRLARR
jgi:hypothetical protein